MLNPIHVNYAQCKVNSQENSYICFTVYLLHKQGKTQTSKEVVIVLHVNKLKLLGTFLLSEMKRPDDNKN